MDNKFILPTFATYRPSSHHSHKNWLIYQAAPNQLRLLNFENSGSIKESIILEIANEPLVATKLVYDDKNNEIYVGIAFLTKFMVLRKNKVITQYSLPLNCNITDFTGTFAALEAVNDGLQIYFIFITKKAQIITFPIANTENRVIFDLEINAVSSLCSRETTAYIGTESGLVYLVDMNLRKYSKVYDSSTKLPIINMQLLNEWLLIGTCNGELHMVNAQLDNKKSISAHYGMVMMLKTCGNLVYSVGDDCILRVLELSEDCLKEVKSVSYDRRPNLLFHIDNKPFINFYEDVSYQQI